MGKTHIGLLFVHGIGEQKRFENSRSIVKAILSVLKLENGTQFSLVDRTEIPVVHSLTLPATGRDSSPFEIVIKRGNELTHVHIHEAWWADLGSPATLCEQFKFWFWGLGQWFAKVKWKSHFDDGKSNTDVLMTPPVKFKDVIDKERRPKFRPFARAMLFLSAALALLTLFSFSAVKWVFSKFSKTVGSAAILTQYVGDVRIFTQSPGKGGGNLIDPELPWRATIRRRMVSEMVAMAERNFDRWYVMGHSLGSVVAFNGVQETEWTLPNYLSREHFGRVNTGENKLTNDEGFMPCGSKAKEVDLTRMMPSRPVWVPGTTGIDRTKLFNNFGGLITYGSPLDKFAALWPRIVPVNKQPNVFSKDADWINLTDATDPVSAIIHEFPNAWTANAPSPTNFRVSASLLFGISHVRYFLGASTKGVVPPETKALVSLFKPDAPTLQTAFSDVETGYGPKWLRAVVAVSWVPVVLALLAALASMLALGLREVLNTAVPKTSQLIQANWPDILKTHCPGLPSNFLELIWADLSKLLSWLPIEGFWGTIGTTLLIASIVVGIAGVLRRYREV